jgi:hypothetical protein
MQSFQRLGQRVCLFCLVVGHMVHMTDTFAHLDAYLVKDATICPNLQNGMHTGFLARETHKTRFSFYRVRFGEHVQQAIGKNFQGVYFPHFLAKIGAGRAQLGVFGHCGAIGAIYFAF